VERGSGVHYAVELLFDPELRGDRVRAALRPVECLVRVPLQT
jgi:hypothetical protein